VELLTIICDGSLADFRLFQTNNETKNVFSQYSLDADAVERSVKLLTLCSLAAQASDRSVSFLTIQEALQIDEAEVELWVIDAIGQRLLEASIDQLGCTVTIKYEFSFPLILKIIFLTFCISSFMQSVRTPLFWS
jgi:translation initiation factor 3 subunit M